MRRIKRTKPSPALLVAVVALVAALAGTAVGGVAVTSLSQKETKKVRKIGKKQANKQIEKKEPGLNVNSAKEAETAQTAASASSADAAKQAENATNAQSLSGRTPFLVKLQDNETETIATNGSVSLEATCVPAGSGKFARILGQTSEDGAVLIGKNEYEEGDFNTNTVATDRVLLESAGTFNLTRVLRASNPGGFVMAPDGKMLAIDGESTALGINYAGANCIFAGVIAAVG
jgi:hypothetical protein